jgi:hypothetical protein
MRVQAIGDQVSILLDGTLVAETTVEESVAGAQVAFWSAGVPITIESVRVIDLSDREGATDGNA